MAFDRHQSMFADSLFPAYQHQASVNVGGGNNGSVVSPFSMSSVSMQEQVTTVPWSHNAYDDPYGLINCANTNSRKPTNCTGCDGETELQSLVSNILDEADSHNSYSEGSLPTCNPFWSPKTLRGELLQYFQPDVKTQHTTFPQNYVSCEAFSKTQGQSMDKDVKDCCQQTSDHATSQQWLFNLPKGDRDSYAYLPQTQPPGLPLPKIGNTYLPQIQQNKYDSTSADENRGNSQHLNNFPDFSEVFRPQNEMTSPCFYPHDEGPYIPSRAKPASSNEQYVPQDINQLVSSFQLFMTGEDDGSCHGDFPDMDKDTVGMQHEDRMVEQWKITCPPMSKQSTLTIQTQKELLGESGIIQMERKGVVRNGSVNCDDFKDLPGFSPQNTEHFQQPKLTSGSFCIPNQYQNKMTMHRENNSLPVNMRTNPYLKHHLQQGQTQGKIKPQMQKEKKRMHMSGVAGEGFSTRHVTNCNMRGEDKKQPPLQNFDHSGYVYSQRFDGKNSTVSAENIQQFMPLMCPVNDPRRHSSRNSSSFSSRATLPYRSWVPGRDMGDMMSTNGIAGSSSFVSDIMTPRGESPYHGITSAMTTSMVMNDVPVIQLYFYLGECYDQWRCLEKERKRTEVILSKALAGKKSAAGTNTFLPKTPSNPTGVDHLIVNQSREQARVASLLDRMESLNNTLHHINIHTALRRHQMAVCTTQATCRKEIANMSKHQQQKVHFTEFRDTYLLVNALKDLAVTTRGLRTALWCALQMTLPKPVKRQDHHVNKEALGTARSSSPFEGYAFHF